MAEVVLADDFTGAAEIAGIAWRSGRSVDLCYRVPNQLVSEVTVIDTNSRLLPELGAAAKVKSICQSVQALRPDRVFKKIDSVLRGPVELEIEAALSGLKLENALVLSANPSKGRTIEEGVYLIDGVPLNETDFSKDPIHPARTCLVRERLGEAKNIELPDAATVEDVRSIAQGMGAGTLAVGGADFYSAWSGAEELRTAVPDPEGGRLWICGSQAIREDREQLFKQFGIPVVLYESGPAEEWVAAVKEDISLSPRIAMEIARSTELGPADLISILADAGASLIHAADFAMVMIEGGATATAIMERLNWDRFTVSRELAPGVVALLPAEVEGVPEIVVKPGSYPWPDSLFEVS